MRELKVENPSATANIKRVVTPLALLLFRMSAWAQHGKAPTGWYPQSLKGHTFTGVLQSVNESAQRFRLEYMAAVYKTEVFIGTLAKGDTTPFPNGTTRPLKVSDLPIGATLTVYYMGEAKSTGWRPVHKVFLIEGYPNVNVGNTSFMTF